MPKATKIVIEFDDGSTYDIDPANAGSIFTSEAKSKKCNHNPPYGKPPKNSKGNDDTGTVSLMADAEGTSCYYLNGIIVCP